MHLPKKLLIQVERLPSSHTEVLRQYNRLHRPLVDADLLAAAINQVVDDRLGLARQFADSGRRLSQREAGEIDLRNSVSRSYYSIHHTIRALILFCAGKDVDGHQESIARFERLLSADPVLRAKLSRKDLVKKVKQLLHSRHLADYHVYGSADPDELPLNFFEASHTATEFAEWFVNKAEEFVRYKRTGT